MHEAGIARQLLDVVLVHAGGSRVEVVRGWIADAEALSRDSLAFHFDAHARGTAAEGARLELRLVQLEARCRPCGRSFAADHHRVLLCPACGAVDAELVGPVGIGIDALEVV